MSNILVYGFYFKGNTGDDLFMDAFKHIFPQLSFTFTNTITAELLQKHDAVFIGGGSFLDSPLNINLNILNLLKKKPIFYIGVGTETNIHPIHIELMRLAKLIAIRTSDKLHYLSTLNKNVMVIPDIVYSLSDKVFLNEKNPQSVLILPNITVVPKQDEPHWKHAAWEFFKSEFSQFLNILSDSNYTINFLSMHNGNESSDTWAAIELINRMNARKNKYLLPQINGVENLSTLISSYEIVITQRFHGMVLSEMAKTPYLSIYHHDKLKAISNYGGGSIPYYSCNKNLLLHKFKKIKDITSSLSIERNIFKELNESVLNILSGE